MRLSGRLILVSEAASTDNKKEQDAASSEAASCPWKRGVSPYFVCSTCTGAVGISLNWGMDGSRGAATSLVQQQDEARTAVALTAMASSKRIMVELVCLMMDFEIDIDHWGSKKPHPASD